MIKVTQIKNSKCKQFKQVKILTPIKPSTFETMEVKNSTIEFYVNLKVFKGDNVLPSLGQYFQNENEFIQYCNI
jgi:hypothetical protein